MAIDRSGTRKEAGKRRLRPYIRPSLYTFSISVINSSIKPAKIAKIEDILAGFAPCPKA
jgi:hypothetical protein